MTQSKNLWSIQAWKNHQVQSQQPRKWQEQNMNKEKRCQIHTKATRVFRTLWTPVFAFSKEAFASSLSPCVSCLMREADVLCPVNISVRSRTGTHSMPSFGFFTILRPSLSLTYFLRSAADLNWIFLGLFAGSSKKDFRSTKLETCPSRWIHGKYGRSGGKLEPSTKTKRPTHQESESQATRLLKAWRDQKQMTHNDMSPEFSGRVSILPTWPPENRRSLPDYVWPILGGHNARACPFGQERGTAHEAYHDEGWGTWCELESCSKINACIELNMIQAIRSEQMNKQQYKKTGGQIHRVIESYNIIHDLAINVLNLQDSGKIYQQLSGYIRLYYIQTRLYYTYKDLQESNIQYLLRIFPNRISFLCHHTPCQEAFPEPPRADPLLPWEHAASHQWMIPEACKNSSHQWSRPSCNAELSLQSHLDCPWQQWNSAV